MYNHTVSSRTALPAVHHLVVAVYLTAAGWFFVLAPWSGFWTRQVVGNAPFWLATVLAMPSLRGVVSAFGVLHFAAAYVWLDSATPKV